MADGSGLRSVADALAGVAQWRTDEEARHGTELAEVDQEVASLQTGIENLKQQLEALGRFRTELLGKVDSIEEEVAGRNYNAVFDVLGDQLVGLSSRAGGLLQKERVRDAQLAETLDDPVVANLLAEYQQFKEVVEPTLASIPATYRTVMEETGRKQRQDLESRLAHVGTEPIEYEGEPLPLDVLVAVDAPDGQSEVLMLVMPVADAVHGDWRSRDEDLQTRLAACIMQGAFATAAEMGLGGNQAVFGGHRGQLAVELELAGGDPAAIAESFRSSIQETLAASPELIAAKVAATVRVIEVDHLLPPEEPENGEAQA
ncbi:MAG: hypothetical protein ACJAZO_002940 [Myxococcota bacterium]|jgi:hypothetical protein